MGTDLAFSLVIGYLLGAIPVGIFAGRALGGIDPRDAGSRNIGFTNVLRVAGTAPGVVTLIGDLGKGVLAVLIARHYLGAAGNAAFGAVPYVRQELSRRFRAERGTWPLWVELSCGFIVKVPRGAVPAEFKGELS